MNINHLNIKDMTVEDVVRSLAQDDDFLEMFTNPWDKPENIRDQLIIQYNKLTNSSIPTNAERSR
jgi:hypothetical protein